MAATQLFKEGKYERDTWSKHFPWEQNLLSGVDPMKISCQWFVKNVELNGTQIALKIDLRVADSSAIQS